MGGSPQPGSNHSGWQNRLWISAQVWGYTFTAQWPVHKLQSAVFQEMCKLLGIEKTQTTIFFCAQSDGQVEHFNAILQKILANTAERCHCDWDRMIPYAAMATRHSFTELCMMLFGREITEAIDLVADPPPNTKDVIVLPDCVMQLRKRLELSHQLARETLGQSAERAKRQCDKNHLPSPIRGGRCSMVPDQRHKGSEEQSEEVPTFLQGAFQSWCFSCCKQQLYSSDWI